MSLIPKAQVTEENGEISCSIEETNRIRALLGLKPLNENKANAEAIAVENFRLKREEEERNRNAAILRSNIEKARERRLLNEGIEGKSLGEVSKDDADEAALLSAADWVRRSRTKALEQPAVIKKLDNKADISQSTQYDEKNLAGLKILHSANDFEAGEEIILTLADSNILSTNDRHHIVGLNDGDDVLENINMTEEEKRIEREKKRKRSRLPVYVAYDDDEFAEDFNPNKPKALLQHYDEIKSSKAPRMEIGFHGSIVGFGDSSSAFRGDVFSKSSIKAESTESTGAPTSFKQLPTQTDFYSPDEYNALFKKPKEKKKRQAQRKHREEDDDEGPADLEKLLASNATEDGDDKGAVLSAPSRDHGSRSTVNRISSATQDDIEKRKAGYEKALQTANEKTNRTFAAPSKASSISEKDDDGFDYTVNVIRIRQQAMQQSNATSNSNSENVMDRGAQRTLELLQRQRDLDREKNATVEMNVGVAESKSADDQAIVQDGVFDIDNEGRRRDGRLVFSSTTEFSSRLQSLLNEKARSHAEKAVRDQVNLTAEPSKSKRRLHQQGMDIDGEDAEETNREAFVEDDDGSSVSDGGSSDGSDNEGDNDSGDDQQKGEEDQMGFLHRQPLASKGMAAALELLKSSGELKAREDYAGRAKDERKKNAPSDMANSEVKLEYRDEFGRKLTSKEAYRQLCYKFHGYGPGKKKLDKRLKAMEIQTKSNTSLSAVDTVTMKSLTRAQEATGKAHITIQGGSTTSGTSNAISNLASVLLAKSAKKNKSGPPKK